MVCDGAAASAWLGSGKDFLILASACTVPARGCGDRESLISAIRTKQGSHWGR